MQGLDSLSLLRGRYKKKLLKEETCLEEIELDQIESILSDLELSDRYFQIIQDELTRYINSSKSYLLEDELIVVEKNIRI